MGERTLSTARVDLVRSGAQRVALAATGIVAALYLLIAVAVVLIVTHNLTSNVDGTLSQWLTSMAADRQTVARGFPGPHGGPRIGDAPVLWWMWHPDGNFSDSSAEAQSVKLPVPPTTGWTAFFVELVYPSAGPVPFKFTTQVQILPHVLPHRMEELQKTGK